MNNKFVKCLSKFTSLSDELMDKIAEDSIVKSFKNGTVLLRQGDIANECYLIFEGCIRSYLVRDGEEKTLEFYTEDQPVSPITFGKKIPSEHYLECIEDTTACVSTLEHELEMFRKYPQVESACRMVAEEVMAKYQASFAYYKISTPEDRYLKLLEDRPGLIQRVPQYQLASYLGIKPESLSRIRKRLSEKQQYRMLESLTDMGKKSRNR